MAVKNGEKIRCDACGYETTVDEQHNAQTDLMIRKVGGTHVCDRFEYGFFQRVPTSKKKK